MTEAEIMKALECCPQCNHKECPFEPMEQAKGTIGCCDELLQTVFALINRKNAEIEVLMNENPKYNLNAYLEFFSLCKVEAIKEVLEKVEALFPSDERITTISRFTLRQIAKEMGVE